MEVVDRFERSQFGVARRSLGRLPGCASWKGRVSEPNARCGRVGGGACCLTALKWRSAFVRSVDPAPGLVTSAGITRCAPTGDPRRVCRRTLAGCMYHDCICWQRGPGQGAPWLRVERGYRFPFLGRCVWPRLSKACRAGASTPDQGIRARSGALRQILPKSSPPQDRAAFSENGAMAVEMSRRWFAGGNNGRDTGIFATWSGVARLHRVASGQAGRRRTSVDRHDAALSPLKRSSWLAYRRVSTRPSKVISTSDGVNGQGSTVIISS